MKQKNSPCPCGLSADYEACCGRFIDAGEYPDFPEALMRSRYTAFTQANMSYLRHTMKDKALKHFDAKSTGAWAASVEWLGLELIASETKGNRGSVEFRARFNDAGEAGEICEVSQFYRVGKQWYYTGQ